MRPILPITNYNYRITAGRNALANFILRN